MSEDCYFNINHYTLKASTYIYDKNNLLIRDDEDVAKERISIVSHHVNAAFSALDLLSVVMDYLKQQATLNLDNISSVPISMACIIFITFSHCKNNQKFYHMRFNSGAGIVNLFKKATDVHSKFLYNLDSVIVIDLCNKKNIVIFKEILDMIVKIGQVLSGMNLKFMADTWKSLIVFIRKFQELSQNNVYNLTPALNSINIEILNNFNSIDNEQTEIEKVNQSIKTIGFLVKVFLKLLEIHLDVAQYFEEILSFFVAIYSCEYLSKYSYEVLDCYNSIILVTAEPFLNQLLNNTVFLKNFCALGHNNGTIKKCSWGFLNFSNEILKEIPLLADFTATLTNIELVVLLQLTLESTKACYKQFFNDNGRHLYEDLVTNISIVALLFPDIYPQLEIILVEFVTQDKIWTALIAIDVWCLILRYSTTDTCRTILDLLVAKIDYLNLGTFHVLPSIVFLKIFIQRVWRLLPSSVVQEELAKYNPTESLFVWSFLNANNIPLSHRYYVEFILSDLYDKKDLLESENFSVNDMVTTVEILDILSYVNFNDLEIKTFKLLPLVKHLWSFCIDEVSKNNMFHQYFMCKLIKVSCTVIREMSEDNVIFVLNQLKKCLDVPLLQLLICDTLQVIARRSFQDKKTIFVIIFDIFRALLASRNGIVVEVALETFNCFMENESYESLINRMMISPNIDNYVSTFIQKCARDYVYNSNYLESNDKSTFQHHCLQWSSNDEQPYKKIRIDNNTSEIINHLKTYTQQFQKNITKDLELTGKQIADIRMIINNLEDLL